MSADYDSLSRECGAFNDWNGWFVLAPPALYLAGHQGTDTGNAVRRKRYALKADVASQIKASLTR